MKKRWAAGDDPDGPLETAISSSAASPTKTPPDNQTGEASDRVRRYVLTLESREGYGVLRLRALLKVLGRRFRLRCIDVREVQP